MASSISVYSVMVSGWVKYSINAVVNSMSLSTVETIIFHPYSYYTIKDLSGKVFIIIIII